MAVADRPRSSETDNAPPSYGHRSGAIIAGGFLFSGGQVGAPLNRGAPAGAYRVEGDLEHQLEICLGHLEAVTAAAGGTPERVVEVAAFVAERDARATLEKVVTARLGRMPALLRYEPVEDVALHGLVELDWVVALDDALTLERAAQIIEPLGQASTGTDTVESGPFLITNCVLGEGRDMTAASEDAFAQIAERLATRGGRLEHVIKMVVFVDAFDRYPEFNAVSQKVLTELPLPTRSVVVGPAQAVGAIRIDIVAQP